MECAYLSRVAPQIPGSIPRLIIRIYTRLNNNGEQKRAFNGRLFANLETHADDIKTDKEKYDGFVAITVVLKTYFEMVKTLTISQVFEIFCKIAINALAVTDNCLNKTGLALYLGLSALNHSCNPNAFIIFKGSKAILRSMDNNTTEYNDQITIPYCDLLDLGSKRREKLQKQYYFVCNCEICQDLERERKMSSLRCTNCKEGFCLYDPIDKNFEVRCEICHKISDLNFLTVKNLFQRLMHRESSDEQLEKMIDLYEECEAVFSRYNVLLCNLANDIGMLAADNEKYYEAAKYLEKTLLCYKTFYPVNHPALPARMFEYAKVLMLQQNGSSLPHMMKAFEMICQSYGEDSDFAQEIARMMNCNMP